MTDVTAAPGPGPAEETDYQRVQRSDRKSVV